MARTAKWNWFIQLLWITTTVVKAFIDPILFLYYYGASSKWEDETPGGKWHINKAVWLLILDCATNFFLWTIFKWNFYAQKAKDDAAQKAKNLALFNEWAESVSHVKSPTRSTS